MVRFRNIDVIEYDVDFDVDIDFDIEIQSSDTCRGSAVPREKIVTGMSHPGTRQVRANICLAVGKGIRLLLRWFVSGWQLGWETTVH